MAEQLFDIVRIIDVLNNYQYHHNPHDFLDHDVDDIHNHTNSLKIIEHISHIFHNLAITRSSPHGFSKMWKIITSSFTSISSLYKFHTILNHNRDHITCGSTILHSAIAASCSPKTIQFLLNHGANPNIPDFFGYKPICSLIFHYRSNTTRWILPANITQNDIDNYKILAPLTEFPYQMTEITYNSRLIGNFRSHFTFNSHYHQIYNSISSPINCNNYRPELYFLQMGPNYINQLDCSFYSTIQIGYSPIATILHRNIKLHTNYSNIFDFLNSSDNDDSNDIVEFVPLWKLEQIVLLSRIYYNEFIDSYNSMSISTFQIIDMNVRNVVKSMGISIRDIYNCYFDEVCDRKCKTLVDVAILCGIDVKIRDFLMMWGGILFESEN